MPAKRKLRVADGELSGVSPAAADDSAVSTQTTAATPLAATPSTPRSVRSRLRHPRHTQAEVLPRKLSFDAETPVSTAGPSSEVRDRADEPLLEALQLVPPTACNYTSQLVISPTPADFSIAQSFCSYGYFFLAPNVWVPAPLDTDEDAGVFYRPLACPTNSRSVRGGKSDTADNRRVVHIVVQQRKADDASSSSLIVHTRSEAELLPCQGDFIRAAVVRMLRLDVCLDAWYACHPAAAARGFGRTYRSPSVFEDMVKTVTNCNVTFKNTTTMNAALCREFGAAGVAFPEPCDLAVVSCEDLKERGRVGYRAASIVALAKAFVAGELSEHWFHDAAVPTDDVYKRIISLKGFGPYATSNVLQLLGRYDSAIEAWDTETVRLMKELGVRGSKPEVFYAAARQRYAQYAPYQFLAYWMELWENYEARTGTLSTRWRRTTFSSSL